MKRLYTVTHVELTLTVMANSPYHAARLAFRLWIKDGHMKRQPLTLDDGGFANTEVEIR